MKYRPKFNQRKTVAEKIAAIPKKCTHLNLSALTYGMDSQRRNRFMTELAHVLPSIPPSVRRLDLSSNELFTAPNSGEGIDASTFNLLMQNIPPWIIYLDLQRNSPTSNIGLGRLTAVSSRLTLDILDLRNNHLNYFWLEYTGEIRFSVKTILVSSDNLIKMHKNLLKIWAKFFPWGSEVRAIDKADAVVVSNKINYLKGQMKCAHAQKIRFYDVALQYIERKKNLPVDVTGHIASYLVRSGGVNVNYSPANLSIYTRTFFKPLTAIAQSPESLELITEHPEETRVKDIYELNACCDFLILYIFTLSYLHVKILTETDFLSLGTMSNRIDLLSAYAQILFIHMLIIMAIHSVCNPVYMIAYAIDFFCQPVLPFKFVTYAPAPSICFKNEEGQFPPLSFQ